MRYFFILFILLFSSCSYKHDSLYVGSKKTTEQSVANTKKTQILENGIIRIFVTVTYLNSLKNQEMVDENKEQFVIGFHFVNFSTQKTKIDLNKKDIIFSVEESAQTPSVKKLKSNSKILQIIPASNPWSQYFLVETNKIDKNDISFSFKINSYPKKSFIFKKDF